MMGYYGDGYKAFDYNVVVVLSSELLEEKISDKTKHYNISGVDYRMID